MEGELKQDFFISDDGYINIRLKVTTEDETEREQLVGSLMGMVYKGEGFELSKCTTVDQMYFHNQNPLTVLKEAKKKMLEEVERIFDESIEQR